MKLNSITKKLIFVGLFLAASLVTFEYLNSHKRKLISHEPGLSQKKIDVPLENEVVNLISSDGKLKQSGWNVNIADQFNINYEDSNLGQYCPKQLNFLNYRSWNFIMLYLKDYIIQIPLVNFNVFCVASVQIYSMKDHSKILSTRQIQESLPIKCPEINQSSTGLGKQGFKHEDGEFKVEFKRLSSGDVSLFINAQKLQFTANLLLKDSEVDGQFFSQVLNNEKNHYFVNNKKFGIPTTGSFSVAGTDYTCDSKTHCLSLYDNGRGIFNYHTNWIWASTTTTLPDNSTFAINFGDGIGTEYENKDDMFYEDFVMINGKHYKLDLTEIRYNPDNLLETHTFKTISTGKVFEGRECEMVFQPLGTARDGLDGIVGGFVQNLVYGYWSGRCQIDGKIVNIEKVIGTVEHVKARW